MECSLCHSQVDSNTVFCPRCGTQQPGTTEPDNYHYAAFISYRHLPRDTEVAKRVQHVIETYRLPKDIAWKANTQANRKLGKVFRDEDELPATHSLPDHITQALAASRALVVVCSPETPSSHWVQSEIEAFAKLHGRNRIITVLAQGTSAESIPELLKSRMTVDAAGILHNIASEPLAADMRPSAKKRYRAEIMRLIAALVGCSYDDLRQRDRVRFWQTVTTAVATVAIVISGFGMLAYNAYSNKQRALMAESYQLVIQSQRLLEQGDRYGAIETALEALPESSSDRSRPFIPEAQEALAEALEVYPVQDNVWRPLYAIDLTECVEGTIEDWFVCNPQENWFATMDANLNVSVREISTGKVKSTFQLPKYSSPQEVEALDADPQNWKILAAGPYIIAAERDGTGCLACYESATGKRNWYVPGPHVHAVTISGDGTTVDIFNQEEGEVHAVAIDVASGDTIKETGWVFEGLSDFDMFMPACMGENASVLYVAYGGILFRFDIEHDAFDFMIGEENNIIWSIGYCDEMLIAASSDRPSWLTDSETSERTAVYRMSAFDNELEPVWSTEGTWSYESVGYAYDMAIMCSWPKVHTVVNAPNHAFACSAGRDMLLLGVDTGEELFHEAMPSSVTGVGILYSGNGFDALSITCADGSMHSRVPSDASQGSVANNAAGYDYPKPIELSYNYWTNDDMYTALAYTLGDSHRIYACFLDLNNSFLRDPEREYSLDELISMGHQTLSSAGYAESI